MPSTGKAKGNRGEYAVRDILSEWWGESFQRMPTSGALRWSGVTWTFGDLLPPDSFKAMVECKNSKPFNQSLVNGSKSWITYWWKNQVWVDLLRARANTSLQIQPCLTWKMDGGPWHICLDGCAIERIGFEVLGRMPYAWVTEPTMEPFVMMELKELTRLVTPGEFSKYFLY